MRTNEARLLAKNDVNLEEGSISIKQSKGNSDMYKKIYSENVFANSGIKILERHIYVTI